MVRWGGTIAAYFFLSLAYSLVSLAFQINFSGVKNASEVMPTMIENGNPTAYGKGSFLVYWMLNWVGMAALGLACENVAMVVGQPWTGLWLIFVSLPKGTDLNHNSTDKHPSGSSQTFQQPFTTLTSSPASSTMAMAGHSIMLSKAAGKSSLTCTPVSDSTLESCSPGRRSTRPSSRSLAGS